jgi:hypothetical protein
MNTTNVVAGRVERLVMPCDVKTGMRFIYVGNICKIRHRQNCGKGAWLLLDFENPKMPMNMKLSEFCRYATFEA